MGVLTTSPAAKFDRIAEGGAVILLALTKQALLRSAGLRITCGTDSHPTTDPHYRGEAYDVSVEDLDGDDILKLCQALHDSLPPGKFTVLYECPSVAERLLPVSGGNPFFYLDQAATGPHIHIQVAIGQTYP